MADENNAASDAPPDAAAERRPRGLKILLTEGSSTSARQALYCLGREHAIDIVDPNPWCQCRFSRFVRRWHRCPSFSKAPESYLQTILDLIESERYDVLFPTHEQVYLLSRFRELLRPRVGLAVPEFAALDRLMSKANFVRLLAELELPQPETRMVRCRTDLLVHDRFPCFVKLDYSTAGQGVRYVQDRRQLLRAADEFEAAGWLDGQTEIVVQQPAVGRKGAGTAVFQNGQLVASHCCQGRAFGIGGSSMAQLSASQPEVVAAMERLGRHLQWHGAMAVDHFYDAATGEFQLLECNPRIGETVNALCSGTNLCEQLVRVSLDQSPDPCGPGVVGVRTHQSFLILTARALQGATRRHLVTELFRASRRQGIYEGSEDELTRVTEDWLSLLPYLGVTSLLLARPKAAQWLVNKTVENYSLHLSAARRIRNLSDIDIQFPLTRNP